MQTHFEESAPAKLNLFLEVTGRRADGYHDIESVMQTLSTSDTLICDILPNGSTTLTCDNAALSCGDDNLIIRAIHAFLDKVAVARGFCYKCRLIKRIPVCAGLGGGSADAAAMLRIMNRAFGEPLYDTELTSLAVSLGADVPFCLIGHGAALARGCGEILTPVHSIMPCDIVLVTDEGEKESTAAMYRAIDALGHRELRTSSHLRAALEAGDFDGTARSLFNIFGEVSPSYKAVHEKLKSLGAAGVILCGSGPTVAGIFRKGNAAFLKESLAKNFPHGFIFTECG